jgi:hypothetical protein
VDDEEEEEDKESRNGKTGSDHDENPCRKVCIGNLTKYVEIMQLINKLN